MDDEPRGERRARTEEHGRGTWNDGRGRRTRNTDEERGTRTKDEERRTRTGKTDVGLGVKEIRTKKYGRGKVDNIE